MNEHYYTENPTSKIEEKNISYTIKGVTLHLKSVSGVFGHLGKPDKASLQLIGHFSPTGKNVLDIGCGYGMIGLCVKAAFPDLSVTMSDINTRAVEYTRKNASFNHINADIIQSDLFSSLSGKVFHDILCNPPIAAGKTVNYNLIAQAPEYLTPDGSLWLVAYHNKGGETLQAKMLETFGNVSVISKSGGIRVYKSKK